MRYFLSVCIAEVNSPHLNAHGFPFSPSPLGRGEGGGGAVVEGGQAGGRGLVSGWVVLSCQLGSNHNTQIQCLLAANQQMLVLHLFIP